MSNDTTSTTMSTSTALYDLLLHRLSQHVSQQPNKVAVGWLAPGPNGGKLEQTLTYQELWNRTDQLAQRLQSTTTKGDRIILVYPPSLHFMTAFLACCKAGLIAVPVFPPHPARRDTLAMFTNIVTECGAKVALTNSDYQHAKQLAGIKVALLRFKRPAGSWPEHLQWIVTDQVDAKVSTTAGSPSSPSSSSTLLPSTDPSDVAFLQYTSGSTSSPKGVMITHGNLAHNLTIITNELQAHHDDTIVVSWLPQYHDMGLIGSYLGVLYCGGTGYYMSPLAFLQRPVMWMEAVSRYQATHLQGPNFAFKLVARKFQPNDYKHSTSASLSSSSSNPNIPALNLSSIRHVINAAEPVDEESIDSFAQAFAPFGFNPQAMYPTYGLAEHTVFVCSGGQQRLQVYKEQLEVHGKVVVVGGGKADETKQSDDDADDDKNNKHNNINNTPSITKLVGCGYPARQGVDVRIVHVESLQELPADQVGEIWIDSPSKAAGYFGKPDETKADFHAPLEQPLEGSSSPVAPTGYLRTGDLGFFHNQELFICGRLKDLIIVGGRNYYPQDIEATAESAASECRPGCSAAFSIDPTKQGGGEEEICLVMELREVGKDSTTTIRYNSLAETVRLAINQEHSLSLSVLVLLKPKTIPKTSSGKIARAWCRKAFVGKTLEAVYQKSFKSSIGPLEIDGTTTSSSSSAPLTTTVSSSAAAQDIRQMDKKVLLERLRRDVATMASVQPDMISPDIAIATILDSLSLSQFKGLLQSHYAVQTLSDEYLFRESTTLTKLVEIVHLGFAPDDNDATAAANGTAGVNNGVVASSGNAGGIAGALGCPPGVVCCVIL